MEALKCFKCGVEEGTPRKYQKSSGYFPVVIVKHHVSYIPEVLVNCCVACHQKIHRRIRRENKCPYTIHETTLMSSRSSKARYSRKNQRIIDLREHLGTFLNLRDMVVYNTTTGNVSYCSNFEATNGKKLLEVYI